VALLYWLSFDVSFAAAQPATSDVVVDDETLLRLKQGSFTILRRASPVSLGAVDTEERQFHLLCKKYWGTGDEGRAKIYKKEEILVPYMIRAGGVEGAPEAGGLTSGMEVEVQGTATGKEEVAIGAEEMAPGATETTVSDDAKPEEGPDSGSNDSSDGSSDEGSDEGSGEGSDSENTEETTESSETARFYESLSLDSDFEDFFDGFRSMLVRKEYRDLFEHIVDLRKSGERGVVVMGPSGIGENAP
jgi:hypothetical protein